MHDVGAGLDRSVDQVAVEQAPRLSCNGAGQRVRRGRVAVKRTAIDGEDGQATSSEQHCRGCAGGSSMPCSGPTGMQVGHGCDHDVVEDRDDFIAGDDEDGAALLAVRFRGPMSPSVGRT